uniref:Uncharacterized protein n=1 Tax=Sphaerodactylus townsendi TaxID=933632 RepID=A0ACB8E8T9_9SAUR
MSQAMYPPDLPAENVSPKTPQRRDPPEIIIAAVRHNITRLGTLRDSNDHRNPCAVTWLHPGTGHVQGHPCGPPVSWPLGSEGGTYYLRKFLSGVHNVSLKGC